MKTAVLVIILLSFITIKGDTLCDTGIEYRIEYLVQPTLNKMVVFSVSGDLILIVAMDFNRDGNYTMLIFDTNGDGMANIKFIDGTATVKQVLKLYCMYQKLRIS